MDKNEREPVLVWLSASIGCGVAMLAGILLGNEIAPFWTGCTSLLLCVGFCEQHSSLKDLLRLASFLSGFCLLVFFSLYGLDLLTIILPYAVGIIAGLGASALSNHLAASVKVQA